MMTRLSDPAKLKGGRSVLAQLWVLRMVCYGRVRQCLKRSQAHFQLNNVRFQVDTVLRHQYPEVFAGSIAHSLAPLSIRSVPEFSCLVNGTINASWTDHRPARHRI